MISGYRTNNQKYQNIIHKINNNLGMTEDLKKKIIYVIEKYRISILCMEEAEINTLVEECMVDGSSIPIQTGLHCIMCGKSTNKLLDDNDKLSDKYEDEYYLE